MQVIKRWWKHEGIELVGIREEEGAGRPEELEGLYNDKIG